MKSKQHFLDPGMQDNISHHFSLVALHLVLGRKTTKLSDIQHLQMECPKVISLELKRSLGTY